MSISNTKKAGRVDIPFDQYQRTYHFEERRGTRRSKIRRHVVFFGLVLGAWFSFKWFKNQQPSPVGVSKLSIQDASIAYPWSSIKSSKQINWVDCYEGIGPFQCARFSVPLDYAMSAGSGEEDVASQDPEANIALVKFPAKYPPGHENYRGPILFNPGGPGGSGVALVLLIADALQQVVGDGFDLIGFDPRGVGQTTPSLKAFHSTLEAGTLLIQNEGSVNASPSALGRIRQLSHHLGDLAVERLQGVAEHVSTPVVARDMLNIVEALGHEKLQYWGFSYGSVLGATFAAMFPDKVGRLIIDGVVDSPDYYSGGWSTNLHDTDAALEDIYRSCALSSPDECAMYEDTVEGVRARVDTLMNKLRTEPVGVRVNLSPDESRYHAVDYSMARGIIFTTLYNTHASGKTLMEALAYLERGNASMLYSMPAEYLLIDHLFVCNCSPDSPERISAMYEVLAAIACGDTDGSNDITDLREFYNDLAQTSSFAELWFPHALCSGWKIRGKERFHGSFEHETSYPLLLIGNVADPVTPLTAARKMAEGFKDSVVLTQNSSGHCSISAVSTCTFKAIHNYFNNGTLPEKGTVCQPESSIFKPVSSDLVETFSAEDRAFFEASRKIQEAYPIAKLGRW